MGWILQLANYNLAVSGKAQIKVIPRFLEIVKTLTKCYFTNISKFYLIKSIYVLEKTFREI